MKKVQVNTVPNGYTLSFNGSEYMYYTMAALLEGFMYHVGLEELSAIDAETMREFLAAAVVWKDQGETVKTLVKAQKENAALVIANKNMRKQIKRLNERLRRDSDDEE